MKIIKYLVFGAVSLMIIGLTSCSKEFLERTPSNAVSNELALSTVSNIQAATVGIMPFFATAGFAGRNLHIIGDIITDNITTSTGNSGHFLDIESWNISSSLTEVSALWIAPYQIIATSAKVIQACDENIAASSTSASDKKTLQICKATALTAKVYAEQVLTQYFCLPYDPATASSTNGIILVTTPINPEDAINASSPLMSATLEATYVHMHSELDQAIALYVETKSKEFTSSGAAYFPSLSLAYVLKARLFLEQAKYQDAISTADLALQNLPSGAKAELVSSPTAIYLQYQEITKPTSEDIFTINFTSSDNLSANSINNMFASYGATLSGTTEKLFQRNDIRSVLYKYPAKTAIDDLKIFSACGKYPNENMISNVPVVRVPEIYLIKAEAYAQEGNDNEAKNQLLKVLGVRDTSVGSNLPVLESNYFDKGQSTLSVVLDERRREFVGEGHRWADLRRTRTRLSHPKSEKFRIDFSNFPIYNFALPIPESETNTGAWKNGKLKQNEAWVGTPGSSYKSVLPLPINGSTY